MCKIYGTLLQIKNQSYVNGELHLALELRDSMLLRCQFSSICSADSKPSQSESQQAFVHPSIQAFLHKEVLSSFCQFLRQNSNSKWRRLIMDTWHLHPTFGHPFLFYFSLISPFQKMFDVGRKKENVFVTERWLTSLREEVAGIETGRIRTWSMRVHPVVTVPIKVLLKDLIFSQSSLQSLGAGVLYKVCELETWLHSFPNSICLLGEKPFTPSSEQEEGCFQSCVH